MKGVTKRVVEIVEPQNECIERVLVFLRSDCADMRVTQKKAEAEKYVSGLVCYKRSFFADNHKAVRVLVGVCGAGAILGLVLLFLL